MHKSKIILATISVVAMLSIFGLFIVFVDSSVDFDALDNITFESLDLSDTEDGTYLGEYEIFPLSVEIYLVIENHDIKAVEINNNSLFFERDALMIIDEIIINQSFDVEIHEAHEYSEKILILAIINAIDEGILIEELS
jgi:uncharacterized protein with FMN-binding domain